MRKLTNIKNQYEKDRKSVMEEVRKLEKSKKWKHVNYLSKVIKNSKKGRKETKGKSSEKL